MKRTLIRYKTRPEAAEKNAELIAAVFAELKAAQPDGTPDDGSSALPKLAAFQTFQSGIRERCVEPPLARGVTIVGNYRMLGEA
jgi:hypothetical protein